MITSYSQLPPLEQLAVLCGAAEQAGVPTTLVAEIQFNLRPYLPSVPQKEGETFKWNGEDFRTIGPGIIK